MVNLNLQYLDISIDNVPEIPPQVSSIADQPSAILNAPDLPLVSQDPDEGLAEQQLMEEQALAKLRQLLKNPAANWTSAAQRDGVLAVLNNDTDVMAVLATGAGKTMLAIIPALMEINRITVIVLPLKSLVLDYKRKLTDMAIPFEHYEASNMGRITGLKNIVLVTVDAARTTKWKEGLAIINQSIPVQRIVFDEAQFGVTSDDFRDSLKHLHELRFLAVQMVILSGTVIPRSQQAIVNAFGLLPGYTMLRTPTDRPELAYTITKPVGTDKDLMIQVESIIENHEDSFNESSRVLIFVPFKDLGVSMAARLEVDFYSGDKDTSDEDRSNIYRAWIRGVNTIMVCTSAFGAGNDYPHTRLVIHAGTPLEMVGFIQEVGRGGRDKESANCYIIPKGKKSPYIKTGDLDHKGKQAAYDLVFGIPGCIRHKITSFCDGNNYGVQCSNVEGSQYCSYCKFNFGGQPSRQAAIKRVESIPSTTMSV